MLNTVEFLFVFGILCKDILCLVYVFIPQYLAKFEFRLLAGNLQLSGFPIRLQYYRICFCQVSDGYVYLLTKNKKVKVRRYQYKQPFKFLALSLQNVRI